MTHPSDHPAQSPDQGVQPAKLAGGSWQGSYLDAYGHRGDLRFELEVSDGRVRGRYELTVRAEDRPQRLGGELEGRVEGERVRLSATTGRDQRGDAQRVEFDAVVRPAGSYARQALFGVVTGTPQQGFGGGVWILWQFASPAAGR